VRSFDDSDDDRLAHSILLNAPSPEERRYGLQDFVFNRTLGTGSFGRVHLARSRINFRYYAIKVLNKEKVVRMKQVEHTRNERMLLHLVRGHPFIVNLWGTFQDSQNLYMIMDFVAGGELFALLRKSVRFPDPVGKFYAAEVALALHFLHSNGIIYRDLKPENILLDTSGHVKLTDFGFAKRLVGGITNTLCGTPDYLAPEIIEGRPYGKSVDWYALGVLIFEMLAGHPPFMPAEPHPSPVKLYELIAAGVVNYPAHMDARAADLVTRFLTRDVSERFGNLKYGAQDIFAHTWFAEVPWPRVLAREIQAPYVPRVDSDGDASQFARYAEDKTLAYGTDAPDPHGGLFADFAYTS